jgi:threonine dehydrogenase-like Zn-dependent dehydrogenase
MPPPRVFRPRQAERDAAFRNASSPAEVQMLLKAWAEEDQAEQQSRRLDLVERAVVDDRLARLEQQVAEVQDALTGDGADALVEVLGKAFSIRDRRLDLLEQRAALTYTGIWDETRGYSRGCACSHNGSLFVAVADCAPGERPNRAASWRLAIKGADPKGERSPVVA